MNRADQLTPMERRLAELLAKGLSYREIGPLLKMDPHHLQVMTSRGIYRKLGVRSLAKFVRWWIYNVELPASSTAGSPSTGSLPTGASTETSADV